MVIPGFSTKNAPSERIYTGNKMGFQHKEARLKYPSSIIILHYIAERFFVDVAQGFSPACFQPNDLYNAEKPFMFSIDQSTAKQYNA